MNLIEMNSVFDFGKSVIERIWPDANKRAEEMRRLEELRQNGNIEQIKLHVQLLLGQMEVNKTEAAHSALFVAGWRPAIGWTCAISLFCAYVPKTIAITVVWAMQAYMVIHGADDITAVAIPNFPDLGLTDILGLLGGMLGIGAMRSYDKSKGVDTKGIL
jgi:hypothetical protein